MLTSIEEIKQSNNLNWLEYIQEKTYRDCVEINDCSQCYHDNEDELCDLRLLTNRIRELTNNKK